MAVPAVACPARLGLRLGLLLEARPALSDAGEVGGGKPARRGRPTSRLDASGVQGRVRLDTLTCSMQAHSTHCRTASLTLRNLCTCCEDAVRHRGASASASTTSHCRMQGLPGSRHHVAMCCLHVHTDQVDVLPRGKGYTSVWTNLK